MRAWILGLCLCLGIPSLAWAQESAAPADANSAELDAYIDQAVRDWKLPGLSIAVVKDGETVYLKGFGVRSMDEAAKVDEHTRFGMMSTTKALTSLAVAMLVDEGKLAWDDPVQKTLPWFQMSDAEFSRKLTVRDTLRHNAGLGPEADFLWSRGDLDSLQILERVRYLPMAYTPYSTFSYNNVMYQLAGELIATASGMTWERFIQTRILDPLGMRESSPTYAGMVAQQSGNVSRAHFEIDGKLKHVDDGTVDSVPAAGSAWSSAHDMTVWMKFLLGGGELDGQRLVSEKNFAELFTPQVMVPASEFYPTAQLTKPHWITYGLAWFLQDYNGHFIAMHTGSIDGRTAIIGLMPEANLGVYVFGNADHVELRHALMWKVMDLYTGAPPRDWSAELLKLYGEQKAQRKAALAKHDAGRIKGTQPSHALADYSGRYLHPAFGDVEIERSRGKLRMRFGSLPENVGPLTHWQYDSFRWRGGDGRYGDMPVRFETGANGHIAALLIGGSEPIRFVREAPADTGK